MKETKLTMAGDTTTKKRRTLHCAYELGINGFLGTCKPKAAMNRKK